MNKIAIVFWSGTGNTEAMANYIAEGVRAAGGEAELLGPGDFLASQFSAYSAVAFGCPAMGSEVLEEPNSAIRLPPREPSRAENIGSNSASSSTSLPMAGQPKATAL